MVSERELLDWIFKHVPAIKERYTEEIEQRYDPEEQEDHASAYFILSSVLKPHIEDLLEAGSEGNLQRVFDLLEHLANHGDPSVQNELRVTMEEVDIWKVWKFLGATMRRDALKRITWFPEWKDRNTPVNVHVDKVRYQERWCEEIDKIGGFENLTTANELFIRYKLAQEFGICAIRAPQPGGEEWLTMGLPWPWPVEK